MLAQRPAPESDQATWDQKEMPFTEHLRELRNRLLIAIGTVGGIAVLLFWPSQYAIRWMMHEYFRGIELHAFGPADVIFTEFKFSVIGGIVIGLPVLLQQLWMFVVPAIHPRTRRMVYAFIVPSLLLAAAGLAFAHFVVIPRVIVGVAAHHRCGRDADVRNRGDAQLRDGLARALRDDLSNADRPDRIGAARHRQARVADPVPRVTRSSAFFVAGGLAAPDGNPLTMALLALPMYVLYEISIWIIVSAGETLASVGDRCEATPMSAAARALYGDFVRTFGNVLFAVSLFVVWGLLTLIGVIVEQGKDSGRLFSELRGADRSRDLAAQLRQHLSLAVVRRHHRLDLAFAGGLHVQTRDSRAASAAASGARSRRFRCTPRSRRPGDAETVRRRLAEFFA